MNGDGVGAAVRLYLGSAGPRRWLTVVFLVNAVGTGVFLTAGALYYTRYLGFSPGEAATGLALGGIVGTASGFGAGHVADRRGPRGVYAAMLAAQAVSMALFVFATSFWLYLLAHCLSALTMTAAMAARAPLLRGFGGDRPTHFRAFLRTVSNFGVAVGSLLGGALIAWGTDAAYLSVVVVNATSFAICAAIVLAMPQLAPVSVAEPTAPWAGLSDWRFVAFAVLSSIIGIQTVLLPFVVPLWIATRTAAPDWSISALLLLSTAAGVLLQVRASRGVDSPRTAVRTLRWAGIALAVSSVLFAVASGRSALVAVVLLLCATVALTASDLWETVGSVELSFTLGPEHAQGAYQGAYQMIRGAILATAPAVLAWLILDRGAIGWVVFGIIALAAPLALSALRAGHRTPKPPAPEPSRITAGETAEVTS